MTANNSGDIAANRFIERLSEFSNNEKPTPEAPPTSAVEGSRITINRAIRCTIIIGQAPAVRPRPRGRAIR